MHILPYIIGVTVGTAGIFLFKKNKPLKTTGNAKEVVDFFVKKGLTKNQAVGIAGNLQAESNFNTEAVGDNGTAYGLAQWRGGRLKALMDYAKSEKKDPKAFYTQLNFLWRELNTSEKPALAKLNEAVTIETAALNFAKYYERPQAYTYPIRIEYAQNIYQNIA